MSKLENNTIDRELNQIEGYNNTLSSFNKEVKMLTSLEKCIDKESNGALTSCDKVESIEINVDVDGIKCIKAKEFIETLFEIITENNIYEN